MIRFLIRLSMHIETIAKRLCNHKWEGFSYNNPKYITHEVCNKCNRSRYLDKPRKIK